MAFFKKLNSHMSQKHPAVMMIAEESSAWGGLTSFEGDGLGFTYKWNMGWMNDSLSYLETDPIFRKYHHNKLTFSLMYSFGEKYVLPISHDEVVHGKKSLLDRAPGEHYHKFAGTRAFMAYMMTHPGKKLLFMGSEYGPFREWNYDDSLEWFMLGYDMHAKMQRFNADLNHVYLSNSEFWARDTDWSGFDWVEVDNAEASVIAYRRMSDDGEFLVIINFTPVYFPEYRMGVPFEGSWKEVLSSDDLKYGGGGVTHPEPLVSEPVPAGKWENSIKVRIAPHGALILKLDAKKAESKPAPKAKKAASCRKKNNK
jgi:1,4-alpha-glucan branching enzyme